MRLMKITVLMAIFALLAPGSVARAQQAADAQATASVAVAQGYEYKIQPEDVIEIKVWPMDEFSIDVIVRPDGKISYMMTGEIEVKGMTVGELSKKITASLVPYLNDPKVAVNVKNFKTARAFILGAVVRPGVYTVRRGTTILDLLTAAEGSKKEAKLSKVAIIRPPKELHIPPQIEGETFEGEKNMNFINVAEILGKGTFPPGDDYFVNDGDIVFVPSGGKVDWQKIYTVATGIYNLFNINNLVNP